MGTMVRVANLRLMSKNCAVHIYIPVSPGILTLAYTKKREKVSTVFSFSKKGRHFRRPYAATKFGSLGGQAFPFGKKSSAKEAKNASTSFAVVYLPSPVGIAFFTILP